MCFLPQLIHDLTDHLATPTIPILNTNNDNDGSDSSFYKDSHNSDDSGFDHLKKETKLHRAMNSFMNPNKERFVSLNVTIADVLLTRRQEGVY
jgi:hypothetical protein